MVHVRDVSAGIFLTEGVGAGTEDGPQPLSDCTAWTVRMVSQQLCQVERIVGQDGIDSGLGRRAPVLRLVSCHQRSGQKQPLPRPVDLLATPRRLSPPLQRPGSPGKLKL